MLGFHKGLVWGCGASQRGLYGFARVLGLHHKKLLFVLWCILALNLVFENCKGVIQYSQTSI